jgi:hypothetical protein
MMQQPHQHEETPKPACTRCGGVGFFHTPIADPRSGRTFHLFRCKTCENHQWAPDDDA